MMSVREVYLRQPRPVPASPVQNQDLASMLAESLVYLTSLLLIEDPSLFFHPMTALKP